jgi:hypothetical protein
MAGRNRNSGSGSHEGMHGAPSDRGEGMSDESRREDKFRGSGSDRSSSNIGRSRDKTSGSREESMHDSEERSSMHGSSSGTTGLGGERNRSGSRSPGGVEGVGQSETDEDLNRRH